MLCGIGDELDDTAIATPGNTHEEIAIAAARAGKHVLCEKPLALTAAEAARMLVAAREADVRHMVNFNYRRVPDIQLASDLVAGGRLGQIY